MALRNTAVLLLIFILATFAIPLIAFVGENNLVLPTDALDSSQTAPVANPEDPGLQWPYSGSDRGPEGAGASTEERPADEPTDEPADEIVTVLSLSSGREFRYYDLSEKRVKSISAEDYVRGALAAEMPASFHMEALKAQAVSAHTYALYCAEIADRAGADYDFTADPKNREGFITAEQAGEYFGSQYSYYWSRICAAADVAFDYVMVYDGEPILAAYHASSVGVTEAAENVWPNSVPYLVPVESEGDPLSPGYSSSTSMTSSAVRAALVDYFDGIELAEDPEGWIEPLEHSSSGYMTLARVGDMEVHGSELRFALSLRSSAMEIDYEGGTFRFTTTGYGHGVGLSQYGADYMAHQGSTFDEILTHYYPGATLAMFVYLE